MPLRDRDLTVWALSGAAVVVAIVAAVAAFGGLNTVAAAEVPTVEAGTTFEAAPLTVTVQRARLLDELPEAYLDAEAGTRVLALAVDVVNTWDRAQPTGGSQALSGVVGVRGLGEADEVLRLDDAQSLPTLQPGVPVPLVLAWRVDADDFADGDDIEVTLSDMTLYTASFVTSGQWWTDPVVEAVMPLTVVEVDG